MKNFYITVWTVIILFFIVMATVAAVAFIRPSNSTGIDPSQIQKLRKL